MLSVKRKTVQYGKRACSCALVWLVASYLNADTVAQARRLLVQNRWVAAEESARSVLASSPGNADAEAMLGMALYHQARYQESVDALQSAMLGSSEYESRVLYYLGLAYSKTKHDERAAYIFQHLLMFYPESPEAMHLDGAISDLTVPAEMRTGIDMHGTVISAEAGYDTNPDLIDDGDGDLLLSLYAYTDFDIPDLPCLIGASIFAEKYLDLSENDFLEFALNVNDQFRLMQKDSIEWSLEAAQSILDYEFFERELTGTAQYIHPWHRMWLTELRTTLAIVDADDDGYDGSKARLRLRLYRYIQGAKYLRRVRFRTEVYMNDRDEDFVAYGSISIGADCGLALPHDISLNLGIILESREYDGADPLTLQVREDDSIELSAYVVKPIEGNSYLTGQAILTTRDSNDNLYEADELQVLLGVLWVQ